MTNFKVGDKVKFKSDINASYWFIKENLGTVTQVMQSYQKLEGQMIHAQFGEKRVYGSETPFEHILTNEEEAAPL